MKVLVVLFVLVACANASVLSNIAEKVFPAFAQGFVINGEAAREHAAPYIVSLRTSWTPTAHACGGTIISKDWILTAAHCFSKTVAMRIIAGLHVLTDVNEKTQTRYVDFGKNHEDYDGGVGPYDIALLHLSEPLEFNEYVQPAVLPYTNEIHSGETHLYGWGQTKSYIPTSAKTLQTVTTQVVPFETCKERLPEGAPLHETNLCSDSLQQSISACNGDSGGPLVIEHANGPTEVIGVVSWVYIPCGMANLPSVYSRVSAFIPWIQKVMFAYSALN